MFVLVHLISTDGVFSYIETPANFSHPICGLTNSQIDDQASCQWCLNYHQYNQAKHDHRLTVFSKLEDNYENIDISLPRSLSDMETVENNIKLTIHS